ncbi:MAG: flagellar export protein FliJ [Gammaproteobacteria bacterium]|nr:flagellar export protein FliJ [Gammaproteobacteria bacterium]
MGIAESREKDAARRLAELMQVRGQVIDQLSQLKAYREEYQQSALLGKNHSNATFADTQLFLNRLNKSIAAVEEQLEQVEKRQLKLAKNWQQSRAWTRSLETLVERDQRRDQARRDRNEQKEHDDISGCQVRQTPGA